MDSDESFDDLRITFIGQASIFDTHGGATRLRTIIYLLNRLGANVDLVTFSFYSDSFDIKKIKINPLLQSTTIYVPNNLPKFLKAFSVFPLFIYMYKSAKNSDLIFTNFRHLITSIPGIMLSKILGKPIILDYFDIDQKIPDFIYKYNARNADVVFALTHRLFEKVKLYGCRNVVYVPNFLDTSLFKLSNEERENIRKQYSIEKNEIVIGYAGGFWCVEGLPILLQAFNNLIKRYPKIKLAIIGSIRWTNIDDNIPKLVNDMNLTNNVILIPFQPHEKVPMYLSAFDILCCPKIDCEVNKLITPVKVIEYLSMGLPTIASSVGEISDTITDLHDGFLVKPGDVNALEEMLNWVIQNPKRAKIIGKNGRITVKNKYSYEAIETTIKQTIRDLINTGGNRRLK